MQRRGGKIAARIDSVPLMKARGRLLGANVRQWRSAGGEEGREAR